MPGSAPEEKTIASRIADRLAVHLGPHTARVAVKTFSQRALGRGPESLEPGDIEELLSSLRPMLRTLVGSSQCADILQQIRRDFRL